MAEFELNDLNTNKEETTLVEEPKKEHRKVVLNSLKALDSEDLVDIDPSKIVPSGDANKPEAYSNTLMNNLDLALERNRKEIKDKQEEIKENIATELESEGISSSDNTEDVFIEEAIKNSNIKEEEPKEEVSVNEDNTETDINKDMDEDIKKEESLIYNNEEPEEEDEIEEDTEASEEDENKEINNKIKEKVLSTINVFHNKLDLSKFKVKQNAVSVAKLLKQNGAEIKTADWVLYNTNKPITCSALNALEINALNPDQSQRNKLNTYLDIFKIIYSHIVDANKPEFESWLKTTNFFDVNHIYFALYKATFIKSNYFNYVCENEKCKEATIVDIDFDSLVKYKNDAAKEKVKNILRRDTTSEDKDEYEADLYQISDQYAFALKTPSLWNAFVELSTLDDEFTKKYSNELDLYAYIDNVFYIDAENMSLIPVDMGVVEKNQSKTSLNRVKTLHKVVSALTPDQFQELVGYAKNYNESSDDVTYVIPEFTCPVCKEKIKEREVDARELLFTRQRLGAYRTI